MQNFQNGHQIKDHNYLFPNGEFYLTLNESIDSIFRMIKPFDSDDKMIFIERFIADRFPFVSIIGISWYKPFKENAFDDRIIKPSDDSIIFIDKTERSYSDKGFFYRFRQYSQGRWYYKWFIYFGTNYQSSVIGIIFPVEDAHTVGELLHKTILYGGFSKD